MNYCLKELRKKQGLTQKEVGEKIGRSKQWISELERGNIGLKFEMVVALAKIYDVKLDVFLTGKSNVNGYE